VAALNSRNLDYVADSIASTIRVSGTAFTPTRTA
jgi:hypothetical protein